jgi:exodeoxyribonuclease-3
VKIAAFDINDINKRLLHLLDWLPDAQPDVACLQELEAAQNAFPAAAIREPGYGAA